MPYFKTSSEQKAFGKGLDAKASEIQEMGLEAARAKFLADYPAPHKFDKDATPESLAFGRGENEALMAHDSGGTPKSITGN